MSAGTLNFDGRHVQVCEQGADFIFTFSYEDSNGTTIALGEYTLKMQVRKNYGGTLIVELSTENGRITVDSNQDVTLNLTAAETRELPPGKYIYDLEITDLDGIQSRIIEGEFKITAEVTR